MGDLFVEVNGKKYAVEVSNNGDFYDKETKTYSAKTLAGLQRSMNARITPTGIQVQSKIGRIGKVIGRVGGKGWSRNYFSVVWSNDAATSEPGSNLYPILTDAQKAHIIKLEQEVAAANDVVNSRRQALSNHLDSLSISDQLNAAFPEV